MNVPRGTPVTAAGAWRPLPLWLPRSMRAALARELKTECRIPIGPRNAQVHPGKFGGLLLDSGRARRRETVELRARCVFPSGNLRAVTVTPIYGRGDLLWVRPTRGGRARSVETLEVTAIDVGRVQDMTEADALAEGVEALTDRARKDGQPRQWFRGYWEAAHGPQAWRSNPWCWVVSFRVHHENVDKLLERWRATR